ncbi:hypothetical protein VKT23_019603 [Stygiomarasmius scandens]|uniref:Uncharacterized protein n=1 Tax=Marasmiellus scandens TaxID=2682957 RepID=A0ABR1IQF2_9AGAR
MGQFKRSDCPIPQPLESKFSDGSIGSPMDNTWFQYHWRRQYPTIPLHPTHISNFSNREASAGRPGTPGMPMPTAGPHMPNEPTQMPVMPLVAAPSIVHRRMSQPPVASGPGVSSYSLRPATASVPAPAPAPSSYYMYQQHPGEPTKMLFDQFARVSLGNCP